MTAVTMDQNGGTSRDLQTAVEKFSAEGAIIESWKDALYPTYSSLLVSGLLPLVHAIARRASRVPCPLGKRA